MDGSPVYHGAAAHGSPAEGKRLAEGECSGQPSMLGRDGEAVPVDEVEVGVARVTQAGRRPDDGLQDRLDIGLTLATAALHP